MPKGVKNKFKREAFRAKEYGVAYAVRHARWHTEFAKDINRHIYYDEWRSLNALTRTRAKNERKRYEERGESAPHFLVAVDTTGRSKEALNRTKKSLARQTWLPEKVFTGKTAYLQERMQEYLKDADRENYWIMHIPAGDELYREFFYRIARANEKDHKKNLWYTDKEVWSEASVKSDEHDVHLAPDFSPEYLCAWDFIGTAFVARSTFYGEDLAELYTPSYLFLLKCVAAESEKGHVPYDCYLGHVPGLLYNVRQYDAEKPDEKATTAQIDEQIKRIYSNMNGEREPARYTLKSVNVMPWNGGIRRVALTWEETPKVSVIIPNKDHIDDLATCLKSLQKQNIRDRLEVLIVENNSDEDETFLYYDWLKGGNPSDSINPELFEESLRTDLDIKILYWDDDFNYSAINNFAADNASGEFLLLLNNDVELIGEDAVDCLLTTCMESGVGLVGAKLYYEDETVQHGGVIIGHGGVGGHSFTGLPMGDSGYMKQADCTRRVCGVTAACLIIKKSVYDEIGGFDTGFAVAFNDVDLCLRVYEKGYSLIYQPACEGWHAESKSRGDDLEGEKLRRFQSEIYRFLDKWPAFLAKGDPYYNRNLSLQHKDYISYREPYGYDDQF